MTKEKPLSRRDRNLANIRDTAVPVAERIILEEGIDALNARRLANEISVSVGSLYNAFGDLEAVLRAVIEKSAVILSRRLHAAIEQPAPDDRTVLVTLGEAYLDFAISEPQRWWLLFEYNSNNPPDEKMQEFQLSLLEMLVEAGGGDPKLEQHRQIFLILWASVHGLVTLACRPTIVAINPEAARTYIADLVDTGLESFSLDPNTGQ
ncbi:TetR family transcriptional regulator [Sulfitobacter sp. JBTF-M27]|uniref:TetR family transcriptional regulator n=1 Tax=Sulfitobacter sediminilitoris TaxID=2698830 RepID=A0A6P0CGC3_9RHOB|nr:TetR/AcrR family transcriptional regulator [Sulfitobacter sediminilitoris]NEK25202.1 TetR family transcriptional regulator [Sulfitobacter sediminilitoris]